MAETKVSTATGDWNEKAQKSSANDPRIPGSCLFISSLYLENIFQIRICVFTSNGRHEYFKGVVFRYLRCF